MLQEIRQSSKNGWTYIMVGVLIVVFAVFFGAPLDSCGGGGRRVLVAKVGSLDVYNEDVNVVYNRHFGGRRTADEAQLVQQQALALRAVLLIDTLAERALQDGIRIDEDEFRRYIKDPYQNFDFRYAYGQTGKFDGPFYKNFIQNQLRISIPKYEAFKKRELLARKYLATVEMQYQALPEEVEALHLIRNTKVDLEFVKFENAKVQEFVPVSDEDVAAYLASNADDIKKAYEANMKEYSQPEQVLVRRIFILKPTADDGDDKVAEATAKWEKAKERVKTEDFATVAGELTEDYAKEKQGLMDWSSLDNMDQNIAKELKGAKVGDVKEVETQFAYMLVKLEDRKDAKTTPLAEVQSDLARKLLQEKKVGDEVKKLTEEVRAKMADSKTLKEAVDALKLAAAPPEGEESDKGTVWDAVSVGRTGKFSQEGENLAALFGGRQFPGLGSAWDRVPKIGKSPAIAKAAFTLTADKPFDRRDYIIGNASYMIRLAEREEATPEKLEETRGALEEEIRSTKVGTNLGGWPALFAAPQEEYGPWLDTLLKDAIDSKFMKLFEKNYAAASLIIKSDDPILIPTPDEKKKDDTKKGA